MTFPSVGNVIIPTDELICFRGVETTNQYIYMSNKLLILYFIELVDDLCQVGLFHWNELRWSTGLDGKINQQA